MSRRFRTAAVLISIAAALAFGYTMYTRSLANSREALLDSSKDMADQGSYAEAARLIDRALTMKPDGIRTDEMLYLKKAEYLQKGGDYSQALSIAMRVMKNTHEGQQEFDDAWERIVSICSEQGEYGKLCTLLEGCEVESIRSRYYDYLVYDPVFRDPPGIYPADFTLVIESQGVGTVFYTIDGTEPTDKSYLYSDGILMRPGLYTVKAFFLNRYGLRSSTVTGTYQITEDGSAE